MLSLDIVRNGAKVKVKEVQITGNGAIRRLYGMGIVPGAELEVVVNKGYGPIIVRTKGIELALGRGLARRILVEVLCDEDNCSANRSA